ncbi:hypothetical protein LXA43DRAFT_1033768 [Ganoderma leucocontextum]|nr:hypothetical protein LXA43DRAFT_1033768 [Ganoderma leucocontextum]
MAALRGLSRLELFGVRADTRDSFKEEDTAPRMRFLQAGEWDLVTLSLECYNEDDDHFYPPLLSALAAFPRLLTLRLLQFLPRQSFLELDDDVLTTPSFPSIQKLFLKETRPPGFDLVGLCPNVSLVSICTEERFWDPTDWQDPSNENDTMPRALGPRWKPLRSLTLSSRACMYDARTLLDTAFHLEVSCKVPSESMVQPDGPDAPDMVLLLDTLKKVSPVRAQLWVAPVVGGDPVYFWKRVDEAAPRLRFLELKISLTGAQDEDMSWLGNVPNALCALPLVCLRLHLTKTPRYIEFESESESDDCGDGATHAHSVSSREDIQETYNAAAEMRKKLPRRCAGAIRTLKYIAVADEEPSWDDEETFDPCGNWESMDERYGGGAEEYEYRSGWYVEKIKTLRWWRVERSVKKRWRKTKLRPLTPEKGRAVQRFLEEADFDTIEPIDGEYGPYATSRISPRGLTRTLLELLP